MILRTLALLFLLWILFKAVGSVIRTVLGASETPRESARSTRSGRTNKGRINVDYNPKNKNDKGYSGGDYVDYEEVD